MLSFIHCFFCWCWWIIYRFLYIGAAMVLARNFSMTNFLNPNLSDQIKAPKLCIDAMQECHEICLPSTHRPHLASDPVKHYLQNGCLFHSDVNAQMILSCLGWIGTSGFVSFWIELGSCSSPPLYFSHQDIGVHTYLYQLGQQWTVTHFTIQRFP